MTRLLVHVEGQTEEQFINEILAPHLKTKGYESVSARILGNARSRNKRGGIRAWESARKDITTHLRQDSGCIATTMVDFYGLPQGNGAWPGRAGAFGSSARDKASGVEDALAASVSEEMGEAFDGRRFVPFIVMHEFEALLFSDCAAFGRGIGQPNMEPKFQAIRDAFETPEDINDSPVTAPSKRVESLVPKYEKPLFGALAILEIGLARIREECPHFAAWLTQLESLAN